MPSTAQTLSLHQIRAELTLRRLYRRVLQREIREGESYEEADTIAWQTVCAIANRLQVEADYQVVSG